MSRLTDSDIAEVLKQVNDLLYAGKTRVGYRKHYYNSSAVLYETDNNGTELRDPFFVGSRREVYDYLSAMLKMYYMMHS